MRLLVTGGAGFIGSHFIRHILEAYPRLTVVTLDKLTYAGNLENLADLKDHPRHEFVRGDICDAGIVESLARRTDVIINLAAETHVDRSLLEPGQFIQTDVYGTYVLLEAAWRHHHQRYVQVSTDEVYGSQENAPARETDLLHPSSPYAASKAAGDLLCLAYWTAHQVPIIITRCANTFGSHQHPEKFIPLFITNAIEDQPLPLYGDGLHRRDWITVHDHVRALDFLLNRGEPGEIYNIAGGHEWTNQEMAERLVKLLGKPVTLIRRVKDRPGHDRRYALDATKLMRLGWQPTARFEDALAETVQWYQAHPAWWQKVKAGEFQDYYRRQYDSLVPPGAPGAVVEGRGGPP